MSAMYSTIAFAASVAAGSQGASYELRRESQSLQIFGAFNALGTVMFAFGGHAILLEVQVSSCLFPYALKMVCNWRQQARRPAAPGNALSAERHTRLHEHLAEGVYTLLTAPCLQSHCSAMLRGRHSLGVAPCSAMLPDLGCNRLG